MKAEVIIPTKKWQKMVREKGDYHGFLQRLKAGKIPLKNSKN